MDGWMDGRTDGRTEFLPILQDFVPCWGRCPATFCDFVTSKKQGKGNADLMMPFGDWFAFKGRQNKIGYLGGVFSHIGALKGTPGVIDG